MINRLTPVWMNHEASAEKFRFEIWKLLFIGIDDHWWDIDGWLFELIYGIDGLDATQKRVAAFKKSITRFRAMLPSFHSQYFFLHQRAIVQFGQSVTESYLPLSVWLKFCQLPFIQFPLHGCWTLWMGKQLVWYGNIPQLLLPRHRQNQPGLILSTFQIREVIQLSWVRNKKHVKLIGNVPHSS